jgi:ribonuclease D
VRELAGKEISKQQQSSDWGGANLSDAQLEYAASDVRYLHTCHAVLVDRLAREGRTEIAQACFDFCRPGRCSILPAGLIAISSATNKPLLPPVARLSPSVNGAPA